MGPLLGWGSSMPGPASIGLGPPAIPSGDLSRVFSSCHRRCYFFPSIFGSVVSGWRDGVTARRGCRVVCVFSDEARLETGEFRGAQQWQQRAVPSKLTTSNPRYPSKSSEMRQAQIPSAYSLNQNPSREGEEKKKVDSGAVPQRSVLCRIKGLDCSFVPRESVMRAKLTGRRSRLS